MLDFPTLHFHTSRFANYPSQLYVSLFERLLTDRSFKQCITFQLFRHCFIKKKHFCLEGLISCFVTVCGIILLIMICIIRFFSQKSKRNSRFPVSDGPNGTGCNDGPGRKDSTMKESSSNVFVQLNKSKDIRKHSKYNFKSKFLQYFKCKKNDGLRIEIERCWKWTSNRRCQVKGPSSSEKRPGSRIPDNGHEKRFFSSSEFRIMKKSLVRYGSSRSFNSRIFSHIWWD